MDCGKCFPEHVFTYEECNRGLSGFRSSTTTGESLEHPGEGWTAWSPKAWSPKALVSHCLSKLTCWCFITRVHAGKDLENVSSSWLEPFHSHIQNLVHSACLTAGRHLNQRPMGTFGFMLFTSKIWRLPFVIPMTAKPPLSGLLIIITQMHSSVSARR